MMGRHRSLFEKFGTTGASQYVFGSSFEQKKTLEYLGNLIHSRYLSNRTSELFCFAAEVLGKRVLLDVINRDYRDYVDDERLERWVVRNFDVPFSNSILRHILKNRLAPIIERKVARLTNRRPSCLEKRIPVLQKTFDLGNEECEVLVFYHLLRKTSRVLRSHLEDDSNVDDFSDLAKIRASGDVLLGISRRKFLDALSKGTLFKANLLEKAEHNNSQVSIAVWCSDYLSGIGATDISSRFYDRSCDEPLDVPDFDISGSELMVLDTLMKGRSGSNILLYGTPGTGKSSFARALAKKYDRELLSVRMPDEDSVRERVRGIYAAINVADNRKSVILVDEADEIINTARSPFFRSATNKSWVNSFLDSHGKKIIWVTNRSSEIDPSTMRRFAFAMEFRHFNPEKRLKVLKYELQKRALPATYFAEAELTELCRRFSVNAAGIVNAIDVAAISGKTRKETALRKIRTVLASHEKAIGAKKEQSERERTFSHYTLEGLNASADLHGIASSLKRQTAVPGSNDPVSLLLHGMPGTGKTEFVYYLGHLLGKKVLLKRSSEIQSMWVGQTEQNIVAAFAEGRDTGGILLFDEADSFLFPRKDAVRSWEKSHTNEILTQLENHAGIVVFSTNDIEGLDHAALRRFRIKVRFDPLTPGGNVLFYKTMLMPLAEKVSELTKDHEERLRAIMNLTPGDFAVIRSQAMLFNSKSVCHDSLISDLENEVRYKKNIGRAIGF